MPKVVTVKAFIDTDEQLIPIEKLAKMRCRCITCQGHASCDTAIAGLLSHFLREELKKIGAFRVDTESAQEG